MYHYSPKIKPAERGHLFEECCKIVSLVAVTNPQYIMRSVHFNGKGQTAGSLLYSTFPEPIELQQLETNAMKAVYTRVDTTKCVSVRVSIYSNVYSFFSVCSCLRIRRQKAKEQYNDWRPEVQDGGISGPNFQVSARAKGPSPSEDVRPEHKNVIEDCTPEKRAILSLNFWLRIKTLIRF